MEQLPGMYEQMTQDAEAIHVGDPASSSPYEVIRAYPGFYAIGSYRIAHVLYGLDIPLLPRIITEFAHSRTGIDIHPAATIGSHFCIRSEEHTSELQSLMRISYAVFCLKKKKNKKNQYRHPLQPHN